MSYGPCGRLKSGEVPLMPAKFWILGSLAWFIGLQFLAGVAGVAANGGIEPGQNPWAVWNANPLPSLGLILAAYLYVTGLGRWIRPSHPVSRWQRASFFSGLLVIFVALQSPVDALAGHYFFIHQAQHLALRMIGPLLILLGAPLTPILRGMPPWALQGIVRPIVGNPLARKAYDFITNPVLTAFLFLGTLYLWQIPTLHNAAVRNDVVHALMHTTMMISGFLFWWLVVDPKPHRSRLHHGLRVLYLGLIVIPNTVLGAAITFNREFIYSAYSEVEQPFPLSPLIDQQLGGLLLWVVGDMMSILVAGIVMMIWYQKEEAEMNAATE